MATSTSSDCSPQTSPEEAHRCIAKATSGIKPKQCRDSKEAFLQQRASSIVHSVVADMKTGHGFLAKTQVGKPPRGKGKGKQDAPEIVICSSEDEGDEGPSAKQVNIDPEVAAYNNKGGSKSHMEDEEKWRKRKIDVSNVGMRSKTFKFEEGKYAVCANCGSSSKDYTLCGGCKLPLPEQPRFYDPLRLSSGSNMQSSLMTSGKQTAPTTGSKEAFLQQRASSIVHSVVADLKAGHGFLAKTQVGKPTRGKGKGKQDAPGIVICSSEDEGDERPSANS